MTIKERIVENYRASQATLISRLEEIEKNRKIYPLWTIREIVAHLSGWDDSAIGFLDAVLKEETPPTPAERGIDVYNAATVSTREGLDYDRIIREYYATREKLLALIQSAPEERLTVQAVLPWGGEGTFEQIADVFHEHELEHAGDIQKFIEDHKDS